MIPSVISGWPNWAFSEATITSQARASSQPPPSAHPETAATRGVRHHASASRTRRPGEERLVELALAQRADVGAGGERLVRAGDDDAADLRVGVEALEAWASVSIISGDNALRASGRLRRQSATWPS